MICGSRPTCACAAPAGAAPPPAGTGEWVVASGTSHTLLAVERAVVDIATAVVREGPLLRITTGAPDGLLAALDAALSDPEKAEARIVPADGDARTLLASALLAPTVAAACARHRLPGLGRMLASGEGFHSAYQPIVDLRSGQVVAYEALLRGRVDGVDVQPAALFAAAESAGWLHVLDRIGREQAILGAGEWLGQADLFINFNPTSIYRPEVCLATTERAAGTAGLRLDQLVFEVVESHHIASMDHLIDVLGHYRRIGCRVAMDDVGAGYASLNAVARIEPDVIKLDRDLVQRLGDRGADAVVRSIVSLAGDLGAAVLAECVEHAQQVRAAQDLGVDLAQGWFFAHPAERPDPSAVTPLPRDAATVD